MTGMLPYPGAIWVVRLMCEAGPECQSRPTRGGDARSQTTTKSLEGTNVKKKLLLAAAGGLALVVTSSSSAFAYDCFIANRSDRGSQQAGTHSNAWEVAVDVRAFLTDAGFTAPCVDGAVAAIKAAGLPTVISTRSNKVIGDNSNNPN